MLFIFQSKAITFNLSPAGLTCYIMRQIVDIKSDCVAESRLQGRRSRFLLVLFEL